MLLPFKDTKATPARSIETPRNWNVERRWPKKIKAKSIVNTAHKFMVAEMMDTLPSSKPLKKSRYAAAYKIEATGIKIAILVGILRFIAKAKVRRVEKTNPASCDQKKVLKLPILLENSPPKKSYNPHPNIPPNPAKML